MKTIPSPLITRNRMSLIQKSHSFLFAGLITAACSLAALAPAGAAPLITNGSFEDGLVEANFGFAGYANYSYSIPGWTAIANVDGINSNQFYAVPSYNDNQFANNGAIPDGSHVAFMQAYGGGSGSLSQSISGLLDGQQYTLSYYVNARNEGDTPELTVSLGSHTLAAATMYSPVNSTYVFTAPYYSVEIPFTYSSAWGSNLSFFVTAGSGSILLDGVDLAAVPEPQTWALAGLGLFALVFRLRRKVS